MADLLSVQEARLRILSSIQPGKPVEIRFDESLGRILAEDIISEVNLPPFNNSSMDGFAVLAVDVQNANPNHPVQLRVIGDIPAGAFPKLEIRPGHAARIMTGAPIPDGADAVVPVENVRTSEENIHEAYPKEILIIQPVQSGQYIRPTGQDVNSGQTVMQAGHQLRAQEIGLLAMLGMVNVQVYAKPKVAIIATGDELLAPEQPLLPGKIRDSNTPMLSALTRQHGADVVFIGLARDHLESVRQILDAAVEQDADVILTSAGVSVGAYDFVRRVVETEGDLEFWRVNMRPGKPVSFGHYRGVPLIGLPGNPVSAYVAFQVFVKPALDKLSGGDFRPQSTIKVRLDEDIESDGRESYLRAVVTSDDRMNIARFSSHQGSGNLLSLVQANALLIIPSGVKSLPAGSEVEAWMLDL